MDLKEIKDKELWNSFVITANPEFYSFLQSWEWWELQSQEGKKIVRLWIYKWNLLIWIMLVIKNYAKRGNYYFIPHWPLLDWSIKEWISSILNQLKSMARSDKMSFIRFNSTLQNLKINKDFFDRNWFINAPMHEHAEDTHLLSLLPSEEELLQNIKKKDRYYINRAIKEWVKITISNSDKQIEKLIDMHYTHSKRENWKNKYSAFKKSFIYWLYKIFWKNISTVSASYNWKIESILMTIKFWKTCVYYIAASDIINSKFSPNYLCQWEAIKNAKREWCTIYNFWWVSPDENPKHPIAWVSKFKRKFSWFDYSLIHAQDLPLNNKYRLNYLVETFRRIKRWYYYKKPE